MRGAFDETGEHLCMASVVNDDQRLPVGCHAVRQVEVRQGACRFDSDPGQGIGQTFRVGREFSDTLQRLGRQEAIFRAHSWRGCSAQHDRGAIRGRKFAYGSQTRPKQGERQRLDFIEQDDRSCDAVQFPATRRLVGEQALEELDGGGDDNGSIPALRRFADSLLFAGVENLLVVKGGVMLENGFRNPKGVAVHMGGLVDDGGKRSDVDDPGKPVCGRVLKGEGKRR